MSSYGLQVLDRAECLDLLATQRVGRVGLGGERPVVLPVLFTLDDGDIVFRTAPGEKLIAAARGVDVAFEVDDYDLDAHTGWSVLVTGPAEEILDSHELDQARALELEPWAGDVRDRFVRIHIRELSGRRVAADSVLAEGVSPDELRKDKSIAFISLRPPLV